MTIEEVSKAFSEVREMRRKAQEKEDEIIDQLVSDGNLTEMQGIIVRMPGFGGINTTEALVLAALTGSDESNIPKE